MNFTDSWKQEADRQQIEWYKMIQDKKLITGNEVDIFDTKKDALMLKKNIGYALFGAPTTLPSYENEYTGYTKDQLEVIEQVVSNMLSTNNGNYLIISYILLVIKPKGDSPDTCQEIILRMQSNSGNVFVDRYSRVYDTWMDFKENNLLPKCVYCYPQDGQYGDILELDYTESPACSIKCEAVNKLDSVASVGSVISIGALAVGSFVTLAPAIVTATAAGTLGLGIYSTVRGVTTLFDRKTHGQSISVMNQEARQSWLNIGSSVFAGGSGAVLSKMQRVARSGGEISKTSIKFMHTLNTANMLVSGISTVDTLFNFKKRYDNGALTPQDVFNLSCEIMFFFNSISTVQATNKLISIMESAHVTPNSTAKLTKSMKRRLRKRRAAANKNLQNAVHDPNLNYSVITREILFAAVSSFEPRVVQALHDFYRLGHDLWAFRKQFIDLPTFLRNSFNNVRNMYTNFQQEIDSVFSYIWNGKFVNMKHLINSASQSAKMYFKCVLWWVKLKFEKCIDYSNEINHSFVENNNESSQVSEELSDGSLDSYDNLEPHEKVLDKFDELIIQDGLIFNSLIEYVDTFDYTCSKIIQSLQNKLLKYQEYCQFFEKIEHGKGMDKCNEMMNINGDPQEHFLDESINENLNTSTVTRTKRISSHNFRNLSKNFDFWLNNNKDESKLYYYIDEQGSGHLLSIMEKLGAIYEVTKMRIKLESVNIEENEDRDIVVIIPKKDMWFKVIFMNCIVVSDNTNIYLIMII